MYVIYPVIFSISVTESSRSRTMIDPLGFLESRKFQIGGIAFFLSLGSQSFNGIDLI